MNVMPAHAAQFDGVAVDAKLIAATFDLPESEIPC
jgi:hypothetical protein